MQDEKRTRLAYFQRKMFNAVSSNAGMPLCRNDWHPALLPFVPFDARSLGRALYINDWLKKTKKADFVPLRERSQEIFGEEKFLDCWKNGLFGGKAPLSLIYAYWPGMPIVYGKGSLPGKPFLFLENHHTWASFVRWNRQARRWSGVGYGQGCAVETMAQALLDAVLDCEAAGLVEYFGDIDPKGFEILRNLTVVCDDFGLKVVPLYSGYDWLLRHGTPNLGKGRGVDHKPLLLETAPLLTDEIANLWQTGMRIPQEALGFEDLLAGVI